MWPACSNRLRAPPAEVTLGSLWTSNGALTNLQADYKASRLE